MHKSFPLLFVLQFLFQACQPESGETTTSSAQSTSGIVVADTIIYPVDIINLDSTNTWASSRLRNLNQQQTADLLFKAVYEGNAEALDYYNREPIPVEKLKEMEASGDFDREKLAQLQFEETWQIDPVAGTMTKTVQSVLLAWPVFDSRGNFQAYQAGFLIELKQ
ncbi:hypothetical protein [Marinilabilia sp.]|uniref:hypothetical protein n=1 Tax=Marinilabilia sp. TaxID=2021252 RepID=UPI0025C30AA5|nr:hypothetical protein [Marinilabilia sp.]